MTKIASISCDNSKCRKTNTSFETAQRLRTCSTRLVDQQALNMRAISPYSALPRPFLRWAGSKRWLLRQILAILPLQFRTYREPFLGSGALFFLLCPDFALLSDKCGDLIDAYKGLAADVSTIIRYLKPMKPDRRLYYAIRSRPSHGRIKRVAEFLYLNKTCWNGLYRVNSDGRFNVPYGMPKTDFISDFDNLRVCSRMLRKPGVRLKSSDFEASLTNAQAGDLVYLDPPYVTSHDNDGFIDYNETLFSWEDQKRLARIARHLANAGAYVIVTNANHGDVVELYRGFMRRTLSRSSTLASDSTCRGRVKEIVLYSPNCIGEEE